MAILNFTYFFGFSTGTFPVTLKHAVLFNNPPVTSLLFPLFILPATLLSQPSWKNCCTSSVYFLTSHSLFQRTPKWLSPQLSSKSAFAKVTGEIHIARSSGLFSLHLTVHLTTSAIPVDNGDITLSTPQSPLPGFPLASLPTPQSPWPATLL